METAMSTAARSALLMGIYIFLVAGTSLATDDARQKYDRMVEEAVRESDAYIEEKQEQIQAAEKASQAREAAAVDARVRAESERIEAQMDTVRSRGLSTTYTQGMKDNQLRQLQEKLDLLVSDPEAYFNTQ
jgi:rhamnose utilization protein RhaD (predicted bifunctional aldolase and dehydrogenase)